MKKHFLFSIVVIGMLLMIMSSCGKPSEVRDIIKDGKGALVILDESIEESTKESDNKGDEPAKNTEQKEENKNDEDKENLSILPFSISEANFTIPDDVMQIIRNETRKNNITDFIVDLGEEGLFTQNTYGIIEEIRHRCNWFGIYKRVDDVMAFSSLHITMLNNPKTVEMFPSISDGEFLTPRNTSLQIFGDYIFVELFDKDYGKQYVGVNYKSGEFTSPIDISKLGIDTSIIFGNRYFYYVKQDYLHRINFDTKIDEKMFSIGTTQGNYYKGKLLGNAYNNRFSLVGNKLIFSCPSPVWIKENDPETGELLYWADEELEKPDSILNQLNSEGIEFEKEINQLCEDLNYDKEVKKYGAMNLNLDMSNTGFSYSPSSSIILAIDLSTDKLEVVLSQAGDLYRAYENNNELLIEATPVNSYKLLFDDANEANIRIPEEVQLFKSNKYKICTKEILGNDVQSINQSAYIPGEIPDKPGYVAFSTNVYNLDENINGKQILCYDGACTPITNNSITECEVIRINISLDAVIDSPGSMFGPAHFYYRWNKNGKKFEWLDRQ